MSEIGRAASKFDIFLIIVVVHMVHVSFLCDLKTKVSRQVSETSDAIGVNRLETMFVFYQVFGPSSHVLPTVTSIGHRLVNVTTQRIFIKADGEIPWRGAASTTEDSTGVLSSLSCGFYKPTFLFS